MNSALAVEARLGTITPQDSLQRRLCTLNRRRLTPGLPHADWVDEIQQQAHFALLEGRFLEAERRAASALCTKLPEDPDEFLTWFEGLAENGPQGVEKAFSSRPDVALVDIGLPGLDGNEVARRIRSTLSPQQICLIAMTGYGQPEDRRRALQAGFDNYLIKPIDPARLATLLDELRHRVRHPRLEGDGFSSAAEELIVA